MDKGHRRHDISDHVWSQYVTPGKEYPLDDDLVLWFTKKLNDKEV